MPFGPEPIFAHDADQTARTEYDLKDKTYDELIHELGTNAEALTSVSNDIALLESELTQHRATRALLNARRSRLIEEIGQRENRDY